MAGNLPDSGEIILIEEIVKPKQDVSLLDGKSVRVTGRLEEHDFCECIAKIADPKSGHSAYVDTTLVEPFDATMNSLVQFIGELDCLCERYDILLRARVVRQVDGLDLAMYENALQAQRQYLNERTGPKLLEN